MSSDENLAQSNASFLHIFDVPRNAICLSARPCMFRGREKKKDTHIQRGGLANEVWVYGHHLMLVPKLLREAPRAFF